MQQIDLLSESSLSNLINAQPSYWLKSQLKSASSDQCHCECFYLNQVFTKDLSVKECPSNHFYSNQINSCLNCDKLITHSDHNFNLSSEFLFFIKLRAKTLSLISGLTQRLDKLNEKIENLASKHFNQLNSCLRTEDTEIISDQTVTSETKSGDEFSGTTEANEDELLSLLNQIIHHSNQIKQQALLNRPSETSLFEDHKSKLIFENVKHKSVSTLEVDFSQAPLSLNSNSITTLLYEPDNQRFLESVHQMMKSDYAE